jgi:nucleotide-binding universal stress UspA family protein
VPVTGSAASERAIFTAALLASERTALITLVHVIEVPRELPLDALFPEEEQQAKEILHRACSLLDRYGIHHKTHSMRAPTAAAAILEAARETKAQIIVLGAEGRPRRRRTVFGRNVQTVLKNATCRVMLLNTPHKAATQDASAVDRTPSEPAAGSH